ncbi:MAG: DUF3365 domain-containing protein [Bacillota bacterium]
MAEMGPKPNVPAGKSINIERRCKGSGPFDRSLTLEPVGGVANIVFAGVADRERAAEEVAGLFLKELGEGMTREMSKKGTAEAIKVCAELAPGIAGRLSCEHGWRVTRVATRVRNPLLGMPDAWEQKVLAEFAERATKGSGPPCAPPRPGGA